MNDKEMRMARLYWSNGFVSATNILADSPPPMLLQHTEWDECQNRIQHIFRFRVGQSLHASTIRYDEVVERAAEE